MALVNLVASALVCMPMVFLSTSAVAVPHAHDVHCICTAGCCGPQGLLVHTRGFPCCGLLYVLRCAIIICCKAVTAVYGSTPYAMSAHWMCPVLAGVCCRYHNCMYVAEYKQLCRGLSATCSILTVSVSTVGAIWHCCCLKL